MLNFCVPIHKSQGVDLSDDEKHSTKVLEALDLRLKLPLENWLLHLRNLAMKRVLGFLMMKYLHTI